MKDEKIEVPVFGIDNIQVSHSGGWFHDIELIQGDERICLDVAEVPRLIEALQNILNSLP